MSSNSAHYLGLDAGGTQTRWALADASGSLLREGVAAPISGLQLATPEGRAEVAQALQAIAAQCGAVKAVVAGITAYDDTRRAHLQAVAGPAFQLPPAALHAMSDIELTCRAHFKPGEGIVVIAGTGSIAAFIDSAGTLQRAGGRGHLIDDAGGGHWIARQALAAVWRAEDAAPGSWRRSPLARALSAAIGGSTWEQHKAFVYGATRGGLGQLARAVASAADDDPAALALLQQAGQELARLVQALAARVGARPVATAGRVFALHAAVMQAFAAALPAGSALRPGPDEAHLAAVRLARQLPQERSP